jgi:quinol monooxygenase YgiN
MTIMAAVPVRDSRDGYGWLPADPRPSFKHCSPPPRSRTTPRSVFAFHFVSAVSTTERGTPMSDESVILINLLKVEPAKRDALIALLKQNIDSVVSTLDGWRMSRLIAASDGAGVAIHSEWDTPAAVEAMRADPRMQACFPKILALASIDSIQGATVSDTRR